MCGDARRLAGGEDVARTGRSLDHVSVGGEAVAQRNQSGGGHGVGNRRRPRRRRAGHVVADTCRIGHCRLASPSPLLSLTDCDRNDARALPARLRRELDDLLDGWPLALGSTVEAAGATLLPVPDAFGKLKPDELGAIADVEYRAECEAGKLPAFGWYPLRRNDDDTGCIANEEQQEAALTKVCRRARCARRARRALRRSMTRRSAPLNTPCVLAQLCELIESSGGVDAVIGFSQGGELAHALADGITTLSAASQARLCFIGTYGSEVTPPHGTPPHGPHHMGPHHMGPHHMDMDPTTWDPTTWDPTTRDLWVGGARQTDHATPHHAHPPCAASRSAARGGTRVV
jgi:hypothetical protein